MIGLPKFSAGVSGGFAPPLRPLNESAAMGLNCTGNRKVNSKILQSKLKILPLKNDGFCDRSICSE